MKLLIFSGAGLSADSGISTFRDKDGTWNNHRIEQVCTHHTWKQNFDLVHTFYNNIREQISKTEPNAMHTEIANWSLTYETLIYTQNIDLLLEDAGVENVFHVHGKITDMECKACGKIFDIGYKRWDQETDRCSCGCRKGVKPGVIFFGQMAPLYRNLYKDLSSLTENDVLLIIGTSGQVINVNEIAMFSKAHKILVNLELGIIQEHWFHKVFLGRASELANQVSEYLWELNVNKKMFQE